MSRKINRSRMPAGEARRERGFYLRGDAYFDGYCAMWKNNC
ncbi:hypothetical protein ACB376_05380 [Klebsiella electrica]